MRNNVLYLLLFLFTAGCVGKESKGDAHGNFEGVEVIVSAEGNGKLWVLDVQEGNILEKGQVVGLIDTVQLHYKKELLKAQIDAVYAQLPNVSAQVNVLKERLKSAKVEQKRFEELLKLDATTTKQLDDVNTQVSVIERELIAINSRLNTQQKSLYAQAKALEVQVASTEDLLEKSTIKNPINGTVLTKFAEPSELVVQGKPLYKIADLSTLILRAYVDEEQLPLVAIGKEVTVYIDIADGGYETYSGIVSWVSDKAEFTPKVIQTKNQRTNLVYAVKIRVANNGKLKIGMPAEVKF